MESGGNLGNMSSSDAAFMCEFSNNLPPFCAVNFQETMWEQIRSDLNSTIQCNFNYVNGLGDRDLKKEEGEGPHLERVSSGGLMQTMETRQLTYNSGIALGDNSIGDFLSMREYAHTNYEPSLSYNDHRGDINLDNNNSSNYHYQSLNDNIKLFGSGNQWNTKLVDLEMEARIMNAPKERSCEDLNMNQQQLLNEIEERNRVIDNLGNAIMEERHERQEEVKRLEKTIMEEKQKREKEVKQLEKTIMEEKHKREKEVKRLEIELHMMSKLVDGYRKALKETQKSFEEYRSRCPQAEEPLYRDVPNSGGLVLSVMELERQGHLNQEQQ